mgnify:CR=1 FL=1
MTAGSPSAAPPFTILGVRVDPVTPEEALARMKAFAGDGGQHHVVTVNPEFIMTARRNPEFRQVIAAADLAIPDGIGVIWACRLYGYPLRERVTGVESVLALARFAAETGRRLFLLGAAPGVAEAAGQALQAQHPSLEIAGAYAGSPAASEEEAIVSHIRAARPDFLFVAYGAPRQDLWIARNLGRLGVSLAMGVGGTFDFIAGRARRAPRWMRGAGLEWLHRLAHEPWRWRRMLALPHFAALVLLARLRSRRE